MVVAIFSAASSWNKALTRPLAVAAEVSSLSPLSADQGEVCLRLEQQVRLSEDLDQGAWQNPIKINTAALTNLLRVPSQLLLTI